MARIVSGERSQHQAFEQQAGTIEKLLVDCGLTAAEVSDFFISRFDKLNVVEDNSISELELRHYKPNDEKEHSIVNFLLKTRTDIAAFNDDEFLNERHLTLKDIEQFKLRYDGTYNLNLKLIETMKRMFVASLPELDTNMDGLLTREELAIGARNPLNSGFSQNYALFLEREYPNFSSTFGRNKLSPGISAIGRSRFDSMGSEYDFERANETAKWSAIKLLGVTSPFWGTPVAIVSVFVSAPIGISAGLAAAALGFNQMRGNAINSFNTNRVKTAGIIESAQRYGVLSQEPRIKHLFGSESTQNPLAQPIH